MQRNRIRYGLATAAIAVGLAAGAAGVATAASNGSSTTTPSASSSQQQQTPGDPAKMQHGPNETVLTGDTATKVSDAAKAAVPGGTIIRVETDSEGSPYEAHVKKADGSYVTVKVDSSFKVTSTDNGFGRGPGGQGGPGGPGGPGGQSGPGGQGGPGGYGGAGYGAAQ